MRRGPLLASIDCDCVWQTPRFTVSSVPYTRAGDLYVWSTGVTVSITTPGAGNPNHGATLSWDQVVYIAVLPGPKRTEVAIVFGTETHPVAARFKARNKRMMPVVQALRDNAPSELFTL